MRDSYVCDAGVFVLRFVTQVGFEQAREVRALVVAGEVRLRTCDSVRYEVAHVLRTKGLLRERLTRDEYVAAALVVAEWSLVGPVDDAALEQAAALAADRSLRIFDALLVELAVRLELPLLTRDQRLRSAAGDLVEVELLRGIS